LAAIIGNWAHPMTFSVSICLT